MPYQLVIFDFDGTLADSFPWFLRVLNSVADKYKFRTVTPDQVESLRGLEAHRILTQLGVPRWKLPLITNHMRKLKARAASEIALFPGAPDMLHALKARGRTLAVVSSDAEGNIRNTLAQAQNAIDIYACGASLFGKAAKFKAVLKRSGLPASAAITIGDEIRDAAAAREAGIAFAGITWGYAAPEALATKRPVEMFRSMDEIVKKLG